PPPTPPPPPPSGGQIPSVKYFAIVVLENANYADAIGSGAMPYLNSLLPQGSLATNYYANTHPSIGNYFTITTGMQVTNDDAFSGVVSIDNVARELKASGKTWKSYAESIPAPGYLGGDQGLYLRHHNPFSYLSDLQSDPAQAANIVPFTQFTSDLNATALPNYSFIVPNVVDDGHNCATQNCTEGQKLGQADQWLSANIAPLIANQNFISNGILVIVFDESRDDNTNGGGKVALLMLGSHVKPGYQATATYDHRSLLGLSMTALGVSTIPNGAGSAPQMTEFFQ
ncbi:MAG: alkaline phosphatase family protein, partial [Acidobacteriaceae bacterium]